MSNGGTAKLLAALKELESREIRVGWFEGNKYPEGPTVAQVAYWNEYGATRELANGNVLVLPARGALRAAAESQGPTLGPTIRALLRRAADTGKVEQGLNQIGALAASHVKDTISSNLPPPNAEATVRGMILGKDKEGNPRRAGSSPEKGNRKFGQGKGSARTLIDTGQMLKTVMWEIT